MKVFKFGGASVRSAEGVRNLADIVRDEQDGLFIIVSAMGKTTNALELLLDHFIAGDKDATMAQFEIIKQTHRAIIKELFINTESAPENDIAACPQAANLFDELQKVVSRSIADAKDYDRWYDRIVSYGELISTAIVSDYLNSTQIANRWIDMRDTFITDTRHRDANINLAASSELLRNAIEKSGERFFVGQGFIGATAEGESTTLGREGSDYSAAVAANILDAESLSIWKDVEGILNADPKIFEGALYIPELTYLDAIELAYSGAQIIHPKTIKPLQNKNIPLYVRPFSDKAKPGSVIKSEINGKIDLPILILKHNQVLISIRPKDFSFVLEERFAEIFTLLAQHGIKTNLIQSSAVNLSLCVDAARNMEHVVELLQAEFRVVFNSDMDLLTIRGYNEELYKKYADCGNVYLTQKTRKIVRMVRHKA